MKSFTKVAALAAILSTAVVPVSSAMEGGLESDSDSGIYALVTGAGLAGLYVTYKVGSYLFGGKKATEATTIEAKRKGSAFDVMEGTLEDNLDIPLFPAVMVSGACGVVYIGPYFFGKSGKNSNADNAIVKVEELLDKTPDLALTARIYYFKGEEDFNAFFEQYDITYTDYVAYRAKYTQNEIQSMKCSGEAVEKKTGKNITLKLKYS